ncbi:reverse transcriptase domain-containing protein [Tanacetum coccineum]
MKQNRVTDDALRLYLFPYSLTHHANAWFDRLPKNSILTFQEMASKFLSKYFPPSMVTKLRNDISNFRQLPDESLFEAWERYKLSIDRCPNHNIWGIFIKRRPEECYDLIENMTAHHNDWDTSAHRGESSSSITSSSSEIASLTQQMAKIYLGIEDGEVSLGETSGFPEALAYMPKYAKMVKDLLTNKEKLLELVNTPLNENCSAVLLKKHPEKLGDTGRFLIPCEFQELESCMALADLGASIKLMPMFVWEKLITPELTPTCMTLKLATRTIAYPVGIAKDVLVKVGTFTFPADFVIVDYDVDPRVPIILVIMASITQRKIFISLEELLNDYPIPNLPPPLHMFEINETKKIKTSIDDPLNLELKELPPHLEYAFLEGTSKLPVIIAKDLKKEEKEQILKVVKSHKRAIAWKISNIRGIDPNFCTHKLLMKDVFKPTV